MADVTIFHNARCSTSRHAMDAAAQAGTETEVVEYLKTPPSREQLLGLIEKLQGLSAEDYTTPEQVADLLVEHPRLMQRPVLVRGDRAIIGRPKDRAAQFLAEG